MSTRIRATHAVLLALALALAMMVSGLVSSATATDDRRAMELLDLATRAPERISYVGTQYVAAWSALAPAVSTSSLVDITHTAGGETVLRAHGAEPMAVLETPSATAWLADGGGPAGLLAAAYEVAVTGTAAVAGRDVVVVEARRGDGSVAARLWLDQEVGLPLRREIYDESGATLAASAFVEFRVTSVNSSAVAPNGLGPRRGPEPLPVIGLFGSDQQLGHADLAELREQGWTCPPELAGGLRLYEAKRVGDAVQLSYSDGLATVSVFEQAGRLDPATLTEFISEAAGEGVVYRSPGPPSQYVWSTGDQVVTVITDSPSVTVGAVIEVLPPEPEKSSGLLARVSRGAQRLVSWVNPFD